MPGRPGMTLTDARSRAGQDSEMGISTNIWGIVFLIESVNP